MPPEIDAAIAEFIQQPPLRLSVATKTAYREDLRLWARFFAQEGLTDLGTVRITHLRLFVQRERSRQVAVSSLRRRLAALRALYRAQRDRWPQLQDPSRGLPLPKAVHALPDWLTVDQAQHLLDRPADGPPPTGWLACRDQALLELLYSSALRVSELAAIALRDLDLQGASLRVHGKGNREREVPVGRLALAAIRAWLPLRARVAREGETRLFLNQHGHPLGVRGIQYRVDRAGRRALSMPLHPHALRHSAASHLLQSSGDLRAVQEFLGHARIDTTAIYTHLDYQHLAQVYDRSHPRAQRRPPAKDKT